MRKFAFIIFLIITTILCIFFYVKGQPIAYNENEVKDLGIKDIPYIKVDKNSYSPINHSLKTSSYQTNPDFILDGDYMNYGIPKPLYEIYEDYLIEDNHIDKVLENKITFKNKTYRTDGFVFFEKSHYKALNANCFKCHSGNLDGTYKLGLGNIYSDYQANKRYEHLLLKYVVDIANNKDYNFVLDDFVSLYGSVSKYTKTNNPIVNPAFRLEEACAIELNPENLKIQKSNLEMFGSTIASDIPPLWNTKFKKRLYYNGMGEGNFSKLMMQITMFGANDTLFLRENIPIFEKIKQWIDSLESPPYPYKVNENEAKRGKIIFNKKCASCHGVYEKDKVIYKTKIIHLDTIGTDPYYSLYHLRKSNLPLWFNKSWFANSFPKAKLNPQPGYVAPPLKGIWATAPYFHNASVPNLYSVLKSNNRPNYWELKMDKKNLDTINMGVKFIERGAKINQMTFDATIPGYQNIGHKFGDKLKNKERKAVIEYLKTL